MVDYFIYKVKAGELTGSRPHDPPRESIFVAYSFSVEASREFRINLEQKVKRVPSMCSVEVLDGKTPVGKNWPSEIRKRLDKSSIIVADLTVLSPEVLFECGFAWGLGKPILPVTKNRGLVRVMPRWLTETQIGDFSTEEGWHDLIDSVSLHIKEQAVKTQRVRRSTADPRSVVVLKSHNSVEDVDLQVRQTVARYGMDLTREDAVFDSIEGTSSELVSQISHCSLLVAPLQNHPSDSLVHFACGAVASVPTAGASNRRLTRRVLLIVPDTKCLLSLPADSARRVSNVIKIVTPEILEQQLTDYGEHYRTWLARQEA